MKRKVRGADGQGDERRDSSESQTEALAALEAHFASTYDLPTAAPSLQKGKQRAVDKGSENESLRSRDVPVVARSALGVAPMTVNKKQGRAPATVVFGELAGTSTGQSDNPSNWRKFMSSKVTTKTDEEKQAELDARTKKKRKSSASSSSAAKVAAGDGVEDDAKEGEDEKQAQTNDRALSELLSTTLFAPGSGTFHPRRSNGRPNLGSNDTLAKLLELSQSSVTGKPRSQGRGYGEAMLKSSEMAKMPATIRHGMRRVEVENQQRDLERQKELGNYHHSIKGLIGKRDGLDLILGTKDKDRKSRTREKGLGMGVGKFAGGTLKLSDQEVHRINNAGVSRDKRRKRK